MLHLSINRLAALVDEQPTSEEQTHLARCPDCARELAAHRSVVALASSERDLMGLPLTRWETLSTQLRKEGLITGSGKREAGSEFTSHSSRAPRFFASRFPLPSSRLALQVAAALLLVASGTILGRMSAGAVPVPGGVLSSEPPQTANAGRAPDSIPTTFTSVEEANRWKAFYSAAYQNTVSFLAANDSASRQTPAVMRTRLSALDRMTRTAQEALSDAPFDPVINDFYLNSSGQREATLRQLNTVLPKGVRLNSF